MSAESSDTALLFEHVTKRYRLGGSAREQFMEAFGLWRLFGQAHEHKQFLALDDVNFSLGKGRRMGLIGRNGAGKTTLLKLICGNFWPTEGRVAINGSVQALMTLGQGFHPEYTGRENIHASLHYNGLSIDQTKRAFEDVVDFCELGPFLDQPFKTYSSGMQSRLMFATATAIRPDILIVDEVLGAGDAYFLAKSKQRVENIISQGCTLLLVSHSMQQVLELCDEAIWLDGGRIRMMGPSFGIVKAYEEELYGAVAGSGDPSFTRRQIRELAPEPAGDAGVSIGTLSASAAPSAGVAATPPGDAYRPRMQLPPFIPNSGEVRLPDVPAAEARQFRSVARDGLSRWAGEPGMKIVGFSAIGPEGASDRLTCLRPARFVIFLESEHDGPMACTYGIAVHDLQGRAITRIFSPPDHFDAEAGAGRRVELTLNPNQIGPGVYTIGISIHGAASIEEVALAPRYDLLSRSFEITMELPDSLANLSAEFMQTGEWNFGSVILPAHG